MTSMAMSRRLEPGTTFIIEDYADESTYKQAVLEDDGKYEVYEQYEFYVPYYRIPNDDEVNPLTGILKNATLNDANCPIISEAFNAPNDNALHESASKIGLATFLTYISKRTFF
ncbi:hypothetical protein ACOME3_003763 [Neoechinorhynchus agilis]